MQLLDDQEKQSGPKCHACGRYADGGQIYGTELCLKCREASWPDMLVVEDDCSKFRAAQITAWIRKWAAARKAKAAA